MKLTNPFRAELGGVSEWINQTVDFISARVNATWEREHDPDGPHTDITCDSLTLNAQAEGKGTVGSSLSPTVNGTYDLGVQSDEPTNPFFAWRTLRLTTSLLWCAASKALSGNYQPSWIDSLTGDNRLTTSLVSTSQTWAIKNSSGVTNATFKQTVVGGSSNLAGLTVGNLLAADTDSTAGYYERGRTTRMGEWITRAFAAGNYTASGAMTWTVASGDRITDAYTMDGMKMTYSFKVDTSTVGGVLSTALQIAIPGGFTAAKHMVNACKIKDNATDLIGFCYVTAAGTTIFIERGDRANWSAAADVTQVWGQIEIEVS